METTPRLGFLTVQLEGAAAIGALLVTNHWGRPLEFHVTQPVQPTKLQQILYGPTLPIYLFCDIIGRALLEKVEAPLNLLITDFPEGLHCATYTDSPTVYVSAELETGRKSNFTLVVERSTCRIYTGQSNPEYMGRVSNTLQQVENLDLLEPFDRIREAIRESRRLGVISRAA
ncbi:hypothetical protein HRbin36_00730 [bacterium HR36]|nr:hypothetical protein HRbin36_00730 [bacterium HR36]